MPQAILIAGDELRFSDTMMDFRRYLLNEAGIGKKRIREYRTAYLSGGIVEIALQRAAAERTKNPLIILYCGHGSKTGWALDGQRRFDYSHVAKALAAVRRPVTVINDCCYAMALADAFEKHGVRKDRVSLIAASEKDETASGGLAEMVIENWGNRKPNRYGPELRWGAKHDHLFFPAPRTCPIEIVPCDRFLPTEIDTETA